MKRPWSEADVAFLRANYTELSHLELMEKLGRSHGAIRLKASQLGLRKFPDDISFFENWSDDSAHVIGFWAADGYVNVREHETRFSISQTNNRQILEDIQALVGRGTICWIRQTKSWRYEFASKKLYQMFNELFGHDVRHKSRILQWPVISEQCVRHFLRGYCDGDAHIGIDKRGVPQIRVSSGSRDFIDAVLTVMMKHVGIQGTTHTTKLGTNLALYTGIKAICSAKWLYSDCTLAIAEKKETALQMAKMQQSCVNRASVSPKMMRLFPEILAPYPNLG
jgi:hypothetical protein